jgi:hypothetical protein
MVHCGDQLVATLDDQSEEAKANQYWRKRNVENKEKAEPT